jgi:hypothetical protein
MQACRVDSAQAEADIGLPPPLFLVPPLRSTDNVAVKVNGQSDITLVMAEKTQFCKDHGVTAGLSVSKSRSTASERTDCSLAVTLALIPLGLSHISAALTSRCAHLVNTSPAHFPALEWLRVLAIVNIVAFHYYQELPALWLQSLRGTLGFASAGPAGGEVDNGRDRGEAERKHHEFFVLPIYMRLW